MASEINRDEFLGIPQPEHTAPNNFAQTIPTARDAMKAIRMFKDEYLLDYINVEDIDAEDDEDVDEAVVEERIVCKFGYFKSYAFICSVILDISIVRRGKKEEGRGMMDEG